MTEKIRRARPEDAADITAMIHGLAEFERAPDHCTVTEGRVSAALFDNSPTLQAHVAEVNGEVAAMALWFLNFSTWDGVPGIYLRGSVRTAEVSPPRPGPCAARGAGGRMPR